MYGNIPVIASEDSLALYLKEIKKFPLLSQEEEIDLANQLSKEGNTEAAHKLVTSHLRLVAKISMGYKGYGLPLSDVIAEGNIGLMQAVKRFDPDKGFRLATYAIWWIKAAIQEYVLRSWSLVKMGTTANQKKLFFNLRKIKNNIQAVDDGDLRPEQIAHIAENLGVTETDVVDMNRRLGGDSSLNTHISDEGEGQWQDFLVDESQDQETSLVINDEMDKRKQMLYEALSCLNEREKSILISRRIDEDSKTLEELSQEFGISRERVRQIESKAFDKIKGFINRAN
ncbi:MAG: RNA polymerase sigma factor RpoH [Hyphomicrobiales bacterium]|jgi:RNA polymerase sigma-32 factor|nr:RNA polymerase sigma factor RpoH [Alphaproteobacteria bacterium]